MSTTRKVHGQTPEPETHERVLDNNPDRTEIWKCWFLWRVKTGVPDEKRFGAHITPSVGHTGWRRLLSRLRHPYSPRERLI